MKRISPFVVTLIFCIISTQAMASESITWHEYDEGIKLGAETNKKIFVTFYADWCGYCKIMDKKTFADANVIKYLNENFISIKINSDKNRKLAKEFGVRGLPSSWFLAKDGKKLDFRPGYIEPAPMLGLLKSVMATDTSSKDRVKWQSYAEGVETAKIENKKVLISFVNETDPFCQILENNTFTDPKVVNYLNTNYVAIRVDPNTDKNTATTFGVRQTPQLWFVKEDGERIGSQNGYISSEEMLHMLMFIHSDSYLKMGIRDYIKSL